MAQRKRAGPITQRSVDRNHALLEESTFLKFVFAINLVVIRSWPWSELTEWHRKFDRDLLQKNKIK